MIGTNLRGVTDTPSPVLVLDRADLERSGQLTVAAALSALPQNFAGTSTDGTVLNGADTTFSNNTYSTGINLRGLGSKATLVLVNGRRMAGAGTKGDFADVSSIPTAAVERVEILLDGASALYGSDAVGGVVNIILRKTFDGSETQATVGAATAGQPLETRLSQSLGLSWTGGTGFLSYEFYDREALPASDRAYTATSDLRALGGTDHRRFYGHPGEILRTDPATNTTVPGWAIPDGQAGTGLRPGDLIAGAVNLDNQNADTDVLPKQTRHSLYAAARQSVGDSLELLADARYSYRKLRILGGATIALVTVTRNNPFYVTPTGAASQQIAYSFEDDLPTSPLNGSSESLGASLGGDLRLWGSWRADGYLAFAQEIGETRIGGLVNSTFLNEALGTTADRPDTTFSAARDGFFNPYGSAPGSNSPGVLAFIASGFSNTRTRDQAFTANLKADGELLSLPGGPLRVALGGQARREAFFRTGTSFQSGIAPSRSVTVDADRTMLAAFAELRAPLVGEANRRPGVERLELSLAGRYEHYDDFGGTTNPKVGLIWQPVRDVVVRASYGRSFRAPALRELRDPETYSPTLLTVPGGRVLTLYKAGGNPDLRPETATSWTTGVEFTPQALPGLRLSASWFRIRFENRIDQPASQNLAGALMDPSLAPFVTRISPASNPADRALVAALLASPNLLTAVGVFPAESYGAILDARYVNTASLHVEGIDLEGTYAVTAGDNRLTFGGALSYLTDYEQRLTPTAAAQQRVGLANFPARLHGRVTGDWARGALGATVALNELSASRGLNGVRIDSQTTVDGQLRLAAPETGPWKGIRALLNVRNLFDRAPPFYDNPVGVGYDPANADPIGRFVSVQLTRSW